jgi:hypothetical protein
VACGTCHPCKALDVARGRGYVVHIQTEKHRGDESALTNPARVLRCVDVADLKDDWNVR